LILVFPGKIERKVEIDDALEILDEFGPDRLASVVVRSGTIALKLLTNFSMGLLQWKSVVGQRALEIDDFPSRPEKPTVRTPHRA